ncbi:hypothetical protein K8I31_07710, partial [bacterium]|nr:hypothetical protein [bacterium]
MATLSLYGYVVYIRYLFFIGLAIYAFFDWRKNKQYFYKAKDGSQIRNHYLSRFAWGFKILIIYTLGSTLTVSVLPFAEISQNLLHPDHAENNSIQMRFQNLVLPAEVILGDQIPNGDEVQNHVYISTGSIPISTKSAAFFSHIEYIIQLIIAVSLSLVLIRLFSSSVTKPFSIKN